jgi:hypothetical protein
LVYEIVFYFFSRVVALGVLDPNRPPDVMKDADENIDPNVFFDSCGLGSSLKRFYAYFFASEGKLNTLLPGFRVNFTSTLSLNLKSGFIEFFD